MPSQSRTRVAAYGLALSDGCVLLARASDRSALPGTWWLPGGGVDFGEQPSTAVVREFVEETGLTVKVAGLIDVLSDIADRPEIDERLHTIRIIYRVNVLGGALRPEVGGTTDEVAWVDRATAERLALMPFFRHVVTGADG